MGHSGCAPGCALGGALLKYTNRYAISASALFYGVARSIGQPGSLDICIDIGSMVRHSTLAAPATLSTQMRSLAA
eukprot:5441465-Alexandrium_andersonii.AAC.1